MDTARCEICNSYLDEDEPMICEQCGRQFGICCACRDDEFLCCDCGQN
jgi:hypothetical protein